jgi:hypothetical protein
MYECSGFRWGIGVCIATWLMGPRTVRVIAEAQPVAAAAAQTSSPPPVDGACHLHKQALDDVRIYPARFIPDCISSFNFNSSHDLVLQF